MTVTNVDKDPSNRTMTITARFDAEPDRVWQVWADPRRLERWWGPPMFPATCSTTTSPGEHPDSGTQMRILSSFSSVEAMEQLVAMGMEEGIRAAVGQIDDLLVAIPG